MHPVIKTRYDEMIARYGRAVQWVAPTVEDIDRHDPNSTFSYSVGNSLKGYPELLVIGVDQRTGLVVVNGLSELMLLNERAFKDGEMVSLGEGALPLKVVQAGAMARYDYACLAGAYLGRQDYPIMQVVVPDSRGRFPGDPECMAPYSLVPVLHEV